MAEPSRLASALEYLSGLDAAVAPKLRAVSDAIDPVNVARRAGLNLPMAQQAAEAAHFVGPGADIEGMVNDAREGNAAFGRGDLLGALGGYGSAAMAIPMMALPGSVKDVKAGVKALSNALPMDEASRMARADDMFPVVAYKGEGRPIVGDAYEVGHPGRKDSGWMGEGIYSTNAPSLANNYALMKGVGEGENIVPLRLNLKNPVVIDVAEKRRLSGLPVEERNAWFAEQQAKGHDGVKLVYPMSIDRAGGPQVEEYMVPNPNQNRSAFAAFDPAKKDSADLLASLLAAGVFGAGVAGSTNKEPE